MVSECLHKSHEQSMEFAELKLTSPPYVCIFYQNQLHSYE